MNSIHDHGENDYLTPSPNHVDKAIAKHARIAIDQQREARNTADMLSQMLRNGLDPDDDCFAWLLP